MQFLETVVLTRAMIMTCFRETSTGAYELKLCHAIEVAYIGYDANSFYHEHIPFFKT